MPRTSRQINYLPTKSIENSTTASTITYPENIAAINKIVSSKGLNNADVLKNFVSDNPMNLLTSVLGKMPIPIERIMQPFLLVKH